MAEGKIAFRFTVRRAIDLESSNFFNRVLELKTETAQSKLVMWCIIIGATFWYLNNNSLTYSKQVASLVESYDEDENGTIDAVESSRLKPALARLGLAAACVLAYFLGTPRTWLDLRNPLSILLLLFLGLNAASFFWSVNPSLTFRKFAVLFLVSVSAIGLCRRLTIRDLAIVLCFICATYILFGLLVEFALGTFRPWNKYYRFSGTGHPNQNSVIGALLCISSMLLTPSGKKYTRLTIVMFLLGLLCVSLTKSRTSLGALVFAFAIAIPIRSIFERHLNLLFGGLAVLFAGGFAVSAFGSRGWSQLANVAAMGRLKDIQDMTGRLPLWEELISSISKRPLTGHGYMAYWDSKQITMLSEKFSWEIPHGHNAYLDVMLDTGIIGVTLYIMIFLTGLYLALREFAKTRKNEYWFVVVLILFAFVHSFAESAFKETRLIGFAMTTVLWQLSQTVNFGFLRAQHYASGGLRQSKLLN